MLAVLRQVSEGRYRQCWAVADVDVFRLYMQPKADDASHDEALSSRVAALNLMDISLEHLGVDVGKSVEEVEVVLKSCGESTWRSFAVLV